MATWVDGDPYQQWNEETGRGKDLLLTEKGGTGFPYLVFMDADGEVLARQGDRTVAGFETSLAALAAWQRAKAKAAAGEAGAAVDLVIAEMMLGKLGLEAADKALADAGKPTAEQAAKIEELRVNLEFDGLMKRARELGTEALNAKVLAMQAEQRIPTGAAAPRFWSMFTAAATRKNDIALAEEGLAQLRKLVGNEPMWKRFLENHEKNIGRLKGEDGK